MRMDRLVRIGGVSSILSGVLRAASSFASGPGEIERQTLYFIVDLLLLLGVLAVYAQITSCGTPGRHAHPKLSEGIVSDRAWR